jgi:hypothetical protein
MVAAIIIILMLLLEAVIALYLLTFTFLDAHQLPKLFSMEFFSSKIKFEEPTRLLALKL